MTYPMKILALNWRCPRHPQAGGGEVNLFEQARRWVSDGHDVTVLCADPGRRYAEAREEVIDGIKVRRMGGRYTVYLRAALFLLRNSNQFDSILDVANGVPFFAALFGRSRTALLVHHVHKAQWFSEFPYPIASLGWFLENRIMPLVYRGLPVITISPTTKEALMSLGMADAQVHIVFCGVEHPPQSILLPQPRGQRIVYVGRLRPYKRVDTLVRVVGRLRSEFPDIHLDIVGDGDARRDIEKLVSELGLETYITLHGHVDEAAKATILSSATVYATASAMEGWGISVIEANAYGCPAVAYNVPGLSIAIRAGETGLLVENDDEFERAIARLLGNPEERRSQGVAAKLWAAGFTWEACASDTLHILDGARDLAGSLTKLSSDRHDQFAGLRGA